MSAAMMGPGAAPNFIGPQPPDQVQMTFGEHWQAIVERLNSGPLNPEEMRAMKAGMIGVDAWIQQQQNPQPQPGAPGAPAEEAPDNGTSDYGSHYGSPKTNGNVPYGSAY